MSSVLHATGIVKHYFDGPRILEVLRGVELDLAAGEAAAIMGASGSGKTTLLHLLGGLDQPTEGEIVLAGEPYGSLRPRQLAEVRNRKIGFVFQFHYLMPEFNALENVMLPAVISGVEHGQAKSQAEELLLRVGLGERLGHRPAKLSGGEQQRVALARALINQPLVILADEPTGDLDLTTGHEMIELLWELTVAQRKALLIATHNPDIGSRAGRLFHLYQGMLHAIDSPAEILKVPPEEGG